MPLRRTGDYNVEFKLYSAASGGTAEWTEDYTYNSGSGSSDIRIHVANGYLSVNLGSQCPFTGGTCQGNTNTAINWDQQQYLTMNIGGTSGSSVTWDGEMNPRLPLTSVPYAFQAKQAENLYYDGTNGYTSTLDFQDATVGNQIFQIADQAAAGTYNLLTAPSGGTYTGVGVELQSTTPGTAQGGNFNVSGTGIVGTEVETPIVDAATSGGALYLGSGNAASGSITVGYGMGSGTINIGGGGQTGTINLGRSSASNTINIGSSIGTSATQTINIGTSSTSGSTTDVTVGSTISTSQTILQAGGTSENITGTGINVVSDSATAVSIGNGAFGTSNTFNVDTTADANNLTLGLSGGADNADFEAGSGSWVVRGGASRTYNGSQSLYGTHSEKVTTTATAGDGIDLPITLTAIQEYTLSFNVYTGSGNTIPAYDLVFGYAYDGSNETTDVCDNGASATTSGGWEYESCTFTPATISGSPYIFIKQADATARTFFIDGVDLEATTSVNQPVYHVGTVQLAGALTSPLVLQPASNYTNALDVLNANGQEQLVVDTVNNQVLIGTQTGSAKLTVATSSHVAGKFIQNGTSDILDLANSGGDVLTVSSTGTTLLKTSTDSTTALQVENHSGTTVLDADTSNGYVGIGTASPGRTLDVAVNSSQVAAPMALLEQAGTGDSSMEFKDPNNSYYVGQDASSSDALVISSGYAATHNRSSGSPYVLGYTSIAHSFEDSGNNGLITSMPFTTSLAGNLSQISVDFANDNPGDHFAVAVYADSGGNYPGTLLASSPSTTITINTADGDNWNTATLSSTVSLSASTKYWLAYETDDSGVAYWLDTTKGNVCWQAISGSYGSWTPTNSTSCDNGYNANTYGIYGMVTPTGSSHSLTDTFSNPLFTLSQDGFATFEGMTGSDTAFQIQDSAGASMFQVNTNTKSVQVASSIDTIGSNNLAIGGVNATGVDIGNTGADDLTTIYGSALIKSATGLNSTTAFQVQNADGSNTVLDVDTVNSYVTIDGYTTINRAGVPLSLNSTGSTPETGVLLNVSGSIEGEIGIAGSTGHILDQTTANDLALKSINGNIFLGADSSSNASVEIANGGAALFQNNTDSTTAFQVQASGSFGSGSPVLDVDTTNKRVGIGTNSPSSALDVAVNSTSTATPTLLLEQAGTGDTSLQLKASNSDSYYIGADSIDSNTFKISRFVLINSYRQVCQP